MKKTALLIFALYANSVYTDEYIYFQNTEELYDEVEKRSAKLGACLKKHQLLQLDFADSLFPGAVDELMCLSEHELEDYPILKKQFLSDLLIGLSVGAFDAKDYAQAEHFCDLAMATDPENSDAYEGKAYFRREAGDEAQALAYEKIIREKDIERTLKAPNLDLYFD